MWNIKLLTNASRQDVEQLLQIEEACFSTPMTEGQITGLLQQNTTRYYVAGEPEEEKILGSVWLQSVVDEGYIGNVAVRPGHRRKGMAKALLCAVEADARRDGLCFLTLEVRQSNTPAIALYAGQGYERVGIRPNYYKAPKEDAVLMTKRLEVL